MYSSVSLAFMASTLLSVVTALGSCTPGEHVFEAHKNDIVDCSFVFSSSLAATYECGPSANVVYNFKYNELVLHVNQELKDGLTIHGRCMAGDNQVAHVDLHMPSAKPFLQHKFTGLNRLCNLGQQRDPPRLILSYYTMNSAEGSDCAKHPANPIN